MKDILCVAGWDNMSAFLYGRWCYQPKG